MDKYQKILIEPLADKNLSLKAKGLMTYLQTKARHTVKEIFDSTPDGMTTIMRAIRECEQEGYLLASETTKNAYFYQMAGGYIGTLIVEG